MKERLLFLICFLCISFMLSLIHIWGRIEETYGEDPYLIAEMGVAFIKGY